MLVQIQFWALSVSIVFRMFWGGYFGARLFRFQDRYTATLKSLNVRSRPFIPRFYLSKCCSSSVRSGLPGVAAPVANIETRSKRRSSFAIFRQGNKAKPVNVETRARIEPSPSNG